MFPFAGEPIFRSRSNTCLAFPVEAGTRNHRCEAVYRAIQEQPSNPNVSAVAERGLTNVKFVHADIPPKVWKRFIDCHNTFHGGSGINFVDFLEESLQLEAEWEMDCQKTALHSANPKYKTFYKEFIMKKSILIDSYVLFSVMFFMFVLCFLCVCTCGKDSRKDE